MARRDGKSRSRPKPARAANSAGEMKLYGARTCLAVFENRPRDIIRVYVNQQTLQQAAAILKYCAANSKAYHVVEDEDLARFTEATHHEGMAMLVRRRKAVGEGEFFKRIEADPPRPVFFFDGVSNPHNLGAILRTLAHFGISWVLGGQAAVPELSPSAMRISEGGGELVNLVRLSSPAATLRRLAKLGWDIVGTSSHHAESINKWKPSPKSVIVLGAEGTGVSKEIDCLCTRRLAIPGTGRVESLNVSVAAGILASRATESWFQ